MLKFLYSEKKKKKTLTSQRFYLLIELQALFSTFQENLLEEF